MVPLREEDDMAGAIKKSFDAPDETRTPDKTEIHVVDLDGLKAAQITLQPGWRWSERIKPLVGTDSCEVHHEGTLVQGRMHIRHDDGTEIEIGPGDAYVVSPGHDAWVLGDEPAVSFEFDSSAAERFGATS
jgi:hypothetical protein